jgi:hypothetical protein
MFAKSKGASLLHMECLPEPPSADGCQSCEDAGGACAVCLSDGGDADALNGELDAAASESRFEREFEVAEIISSACISPGVEQHYLRVQDRCTGAPGGVIKATSYRIPPSGKPPNICCVRLHECAHPHPHAFVRMLKIVPPPMCCVCIRVYTHACRFAPL